MFTERVTRAFDHARLAHAGARRKSTETPYLGHVMATASLVVEHGGDEDQVVAALLHDVVEDAGGAPRLAEIEDLFGGRVAGLVEACSDSLATDPEAKAPWWERKVMMVDRLGSASADLALVAAADKVHNLSVTVVDYRRVGDELWSMFNADAGRSGVLWYHATLAEVLTRRLDSTPGARHLGRRLAGLADELLAEARSLNGPEAVDAELVAAAERAEAVRRSSASLSMTSRPAR